MNRFITLGMILLAIGMFLLGWNTRSDHATRELARVHERHAAALNAALAQVRAIEQRRIADMEQLHHDTQQQLDAITAAERRAADERVREHAREYARRSRAADSAAAGQCEATAVAAAVLAGMLGELDALAEQYAADADRRRIAGRACETAYERLRQDAP